VQDNSRASTILESGWLRLCPALDALLKGAALRDEMAAGAKLR
jgi:hypothetical protein